MNEDLAVLTVIFAIVFKVLSKPMVRRGLMGTLRELNRCSKSHNSILKWLIIFLVLGALILSLQ